MSTQRSAERRPRDLRLDVFRGAAMLIILVAHIPGNGWTLWIPARFGFSDATEIFVFSSGLASAMAFGAVFATRGWPMGAARVAHRVWQVYWAHVGVFLTTAMLLAAIMASGIGEPGRDYLTRPYVTPFFEDTQTMLIGLMTLNYVPGLFDILPMYLVILVMVPLVMALHRAGGGAAVAAFVTTAWLAANLAGAAHRFDDPAALTALGRAAVGLGEGLRWMNFPSFPGGRGTWFFNPFAWQLVFFTGFAFGMGWLKPPPVSRRLVRLALAVVVLSLPFAWFRLYGGGWLGDNPAQDFLADTRDVAEGLRWKTWFGAFRYVHFLAVAYLAWVAAGAGGRALSTVLPMARAEPRRRARAAAAAAAALVSAPYAWLLDGVPMLPGPAIGWLSLIHFAALAVLAYQLAPRAALAWLAGPGWFTLVRLLRKVGSQSLAVFMTSVPLSQLCGLALDHLGSGLAALALVNVSGMAVLVGTAYLAGWFKGQPWRRAPEPRATGAPVGTPAE